MPNQNISISCSFDPNNDELNILLSNNLEIQDQSTKQKIINAVSYIMGAVNGTIRELAPDGKFVNIIDAQNFVIEVGFGFATSLDQIHDQYGEQGYKDELDAIARSMVSAAIGWAGSNAGKALALSLVTSVPAGRIGGVVLGGLTSSFAYRHC